MYRSFPRIRFCQPSQSAHAKRDIPETDRPNLRPLKEARTQCERIKKKKEEQVKSDRSRSGTFSCHSYRHAEGARVRQERVHARDATHTHTHAHFQLSWHFSHHPTKPVARRVQGSPRGQQGSTCTRNTTTRRNTFLAPGAEKVPPHGHRLGTSRWQGGGGIGTLCCVETRQK